MKLNQLCIDSRRSSVYRYGSLTSSPNMMLLKKKKSVEKKAKPAALEATYKSISSN